MLCFLSKGYLRSTNCLREVRAALAMGKPLVLVHEADPDKGGGTLAELKGAIAARSGGARGEKRAHATRERAPLLAAQQIALACSLDA